jgi:hypothetical protein
VARLAQVGLALLALLIIPRCVTDRVPETPEAPNGPTVGIPGASYSFSSRSTAAEGDSVQFQFCWGDGTVSEWGAFVPGGLLGWAEKSWSDVGTYAVRVLVSNSFGTLSDTSDEHVIAISQELPNQPPNTPDVPTGPDSAERHESCTFTSVGTDPEGDSICYRFDCGGLESSWTELVPSGTPGSISFAWSRAGEYEVRAMTRDRGGLLSGWSYAHGIRIQ